MTATLLLTEVPADAGRLKASVNEARLLSEVGAMFGSPTAAMAEMVQNAARAQATRLEVTWDETTRHLTFRDNGCGADSLHPFLCAAESLWDPTRVVDAAGLGCFALFALCDEVLIESRPASGATPWRASFTKALFAGEEARHWPAPELADGTTGLTVHGIVRERATVPDRNLDRWRHRYPLDVTFNGRAVPMRPIPEGGPTLTTPSGRVTLHRSYSRADIALWEGRVIECGQALRRLLAEAVKTRLPKDTAARRAARGAIVRSLQSEGSIVWHIDPTAGVRPKLPDRDVLIDDAPLRDALASFADALVATLTVEMACETATTALPAACYDWAGLTDTLTIPVGNALSAEKQITGAFGPFGDVVGAEIRHRDIAIMAGLTATHRYTADAFDLFNDTTWEDDSPSFPERTDDLFVRPAGIGSPWAVHLGNALTPPLRLATTAEGAADSLPTVRVRATGFTAVTESDVLVCDRLWLERATDGTTWEIPFPVSLLDNAQGGLAGLLTGEDLAAAQAALANAGLEQAALDDGLLLPGTAQSLPRVLAERHAGAVVWHVVERAREDGDLEYESDDSELLNVDDLVTAYVATILAAVVSPEAARAAEHHLLADQAATAIDKAVGECRDATWALEKLVQAGVTTPALQRALDALAATQALRTISAATLLTP